MTTMTDTTPRVWIGALGAYNAGRLIGEWCDATDVDELHECAERVLAEARKVVGPLEAGDEIMLADREGFGDLIGEYTPLDEVARIGALIEEHGEAWIAYCDHVGGIEYADSFEEAYMGEHDSEQAYAEQLADGIGIEIPDNWPCNCIDWERAARDLFMGDYFSVDSPSGVYVFNQNV